MSNPLRRMLGEIWAHAKTVRWDIVLSRISVAAGTVAAAGEYVHYLPPRIAAPASAVCLVAAGLCPKVQKAAGIVKAVQQGQVPLLDGVAQAWRSFVTARQQQALARKVAEIAPVLEQIERLKTVQGTLNAAALAAEHAAIDDALKTGAAGDTTAFDPEKA